MKWTTVLVMEVVALPTLFPVGISLIDWEDCKDSPWFNIRDWPGPIWRSDEAVILL